MTGIADLFARRAPDPENIVGHAIAGRYLIRQCLSQGGMGVVYLARQEVLGRDVVVKVVRSDVADPETEARFRREARSLSLLSHPNVVQIHDYGFDEASGLYFIVMEYVRGLTLARHRRRRGALRVDEVLAIAVPMLEGVAEAHRMGMVHRDLKPSNVMLTSPDGVRLGVKLLDFGLSKFVDGDEPVTRAHTFAGSAMYMAPEFVRTGNADPRADVYSLGVVFYQLLSGANPVEGEGTYQVLHQQVSGAVKPLASALPEGAAVPPALIRLVDRCLALSPDDRPADARAVLDELIAALPDLTPDPADAAAEAASVPEPEPSPETSTIRGPSAGVGPRTHTGPQPRVGRPVGPRLWVGLLVGGTGALAAVALIPLVVALVILLRNEPQPPPEPGVVDDGAAARVLREGALRALREGDHERAVALTTEAVSISPSDPDLMDLLTIVTDLRDRQAAPAEAPERPDPAEVAAPPQAAARPAPATSGTAVVITTPRGVAFEIPGVMRGQTPARADLPAGEHAIRFYVDGEVVHAAQLRVRPGGVELVDVDIEAPAAPVEAAVAAPTPAPPTSGTPSIYVFVPGSVKPRVIRDALAADLPGVDVTAFGSFRELEQAVRSAPPSAVLAPSGVLEVLGLPTHLQGRNAAGSPTEPYVVVSAGPLPQDLAGAVVGAVDVTGREGSAEFVGSVLRSAGVASVGQVKRVAEESDLLPLLQFGGADAVVLPESAARRLLGATRMKLVVTEAGTEAGLPALSVVDEAVLVPFRTSIRRLGPQANDRVGVVGWGG